MNEGNEKSYSTETASDESDEVKISSQLERTVGNSSFGSRIGIYSRLLAFCSRDTNNISIVDIDTKQNYSNFDGVVLKNQGYRIDSTDTCNRTYVKEIPETGLLVSIHHAFSIGANLQIYDISQKGKAQKVYSFEEVRGITGAGDLTYNSRRDILGAMGVDGRISYHLFRVDRYTPKFSEVAKLCRKSKWQPQYESGIAGFDFDPSGEYMATLDRAGVCLISAINTDNSCLELKLQMSSIHNDNLGRCRWSINVEEPLLYLKYDHNKLNVLEVEKKTLTLKTPIQLETQETNRIIWTRWIDVCPSSGNLLASGGNDKNIKIYDQREQKIVRTFDDVHSEHIRYVKWSPRGDMLATTSWDKSVKLVDFRSGKILHTEMTSDSRSADSVCFIGNF